jgi:AcrR family transcriptional regulator
MVNPQTGATRLERRQAREARILDVTRELFDARGMHDARVDAIARAAGIDKALIYRHFSSKEELHLLTLRRYLDELAELLGRVDVAAAPPERLRATAEAYATYCLEHPAFVDVSLAVMRRDPGELRRVVSEAVWLRLGRGMARCLGPLAATFPIEAQRVRAACVAAALATVRAP